ncbi:MAG: 4Fe-4S binding protein [Bryobacterales bacterium]|nr:4Fe-4S binding protein [Bryobacterales bacterium]
MAVSDFVVLDKPQQRDLDRCVHCGLCLNACPTYRELGVEMDSPRGRVYQMNQVANGLAQISESYIQHLELCLACRACESACPSGVQYGRLIEAARAEIETKIERPATTKFVRWLVFRNLLPSRTLLRIVAVFLWMYQSLGVKKLVRASGILKLFGKLGRLEKLSPEAQLPTFFSQYGKVFPAEGQRRYRVALLGGCIANISFARLNEATVRVLQKNGCEVVVPDEQTCCGALHVHQGLRDDARRLARRNIDALVNGGFDAIITNAAGCGSTLKEYHDLFESDPRYEVASKEFSHLVKDVNEFLASIELNPRMGSMPITVTYQDSCHLAHGQKIRAQPRKLLRSVPGLTFKELPGSDLCCGSAGIYNVVQNDMAMAVLEKKMENVNRTGADVIVTANPGCMIQLQAGTCMHGKGQPVKHVVEILDEAYGKAN